MDIKDFLHSDAIILHMEAQSSEDVIKELGGKLYDLGFVKDGFVKATLEREANLPTGLELGGSVHAAIPHVDIEYVNKPALGLATLEEPVIFHSMIDKTKDIPVRLVIMLALEQPKSQIEMLQQIAGLLQSPDIINKIMEAGTADEVYAALG